MLLGSMPDVDGGIGGREAYVLNLKAASPPLPPPVKRATNLTKYY